MIPAAVLVGVLLLSAVPAPADDDDDGPAPVAQVVGAGGRTLQVPVEVQRQAGIAIARLDAVRMLPERDGQARVVDIAPLLEARWQYRDAAAAVESGRAALTRAQSALDRLLALRRNPDDVSARQLLEAETARDEGAAMLRSAEARRRAMGETVVRGWGDAIAARALADTGTDAPLFAGEALLLLAAGDAMTADARVMADMPGATGGSVAVSLLGPAPVGAAGVPGEAWFGLVPARGFRVGAHVPVRVADNTTPVEGVRLPRSAIVWHGGLPWAYRRMDATHFARHNLEGAVESGGGWFIADAALVQADVVVRGAQTLLSEELRAQIPDEDDDP